MGVVLSCQVCGYLLQQLQETNTVSICQSQPVKMPLRGKSDPWSMNFEPGTNERSFIHSALFLSTCCTLDPVLSAGHL